MRVVTLAILALIYLSFPISAQKLMIIMPALNSNLNLLRKKVPGGRIM